MFRHFLRLLNFPMFNFLAISLGKHVYSLVWYIWNMYVCNVCSMYGKIGKSPISGKPGKRYCNTALKQKPLEPSMYNNNECRNRFVIEICLVGGANENWDYFRLPLYSRRRRRALLLLSDNNHFTTAPTVEINSIFYEKMILHLIDFVRWIFSVCIFCYL